jgi:hypothetical protein
MRAESGGCWQERFTNLFLNDFADLKKSILALPGHDETNSTRRKFIRRPVFTPVASGRGIELTLERAVES